MARRRAKFEGIGKVVVSTAGAGMTDVIIARALHVLPVALWIGGVSMATTVALPAVRLGDLGENRLHAFQAIERRFVRQARVAVAVVGLTGFYMAWRLDLWDRFRMAQFWWMHALVCVWLLFVFVRCRAFHPPPVFRSLGSRPAKGGVRLAAPRALGLAGFERRDNLGRCCGQSGMVDVLKLCEMRWPLSPSPSPSVIHG